MNRTKKLVGSLICLLNSALGSRAGSRVGMLLYHRVQVGVPGLPEPTFSVTPELFREQLTGLVERGYRFIPLSEVLLGSRRGVPLPPKSVVLTFDDAYESVYCHAYPVLEELHIPATAFLCTAYLDSPDPFPFDRWGQAFSGQIAHAAFRPLTVNQCREMAAGGLFEFGAHSHTHQDFRGRPDDLRRDARRSIEIIRDLFEYRDVAFSFPYGKTDLGYAGGPMTEAARAAGSSCALTTDCALVDPLSDDPFTWGRFSCSSWDTSATIGAKLSGWYGWAGKMQSALDRMRGYDRSREYDPPLLAEGALNQELLVHGADLIHEPSSRGGAS